MSSSSLLRNFADFYEQVRCPGKIPLPNGQKGRIIHGRTSSELFRQISQDERLATASEIMRWRLDTFDQLVTIIPEANLLMGFNNDKVQSTMAQVRSELLSCPQSYPLLKHRLTTSTNMIRAVDVHGIDVVLFSDLELHDSTQFEGELSDGGILYSAENLTRALSETPAARRIPYADYLKYPGGCFSGWELTQHPVFQALCGDEEIQKEKLGVKYVVFSEMLSRDSFYHPGLHCMWLPREMKPGFGRGIALGMASADRVYPPNNSTIYHSGLLLSYTPKI